MKNKKNTAAAFILSVMAAQLINTGICSISATTKEDVIAAARDAGLSEFYIQEGINYLEGGSHTSDQYDSMISSINALAGKTDDAIREYLEGNLGNSSVPSGKDESVPTVSDPEPENAVTGSVSEKVQDPEVVTGENSAVQEKDDNAEIKTENNDSVPAKPQVDFSALSDSEKDKYIAGLSSGERNQIIKELSRDKQLEIIESFIDASAGLGLNVSVDSFTDDKIQYSIRNESGDVVDIAAMGNIVDDTGIDYTVPVAAALVLILLSACGLTAMALYNKD